MLYEAIWEHKLDFAGTANKMSLTAKNIYMYISVDTFS